MRSDIIFEHAWEKKLDACNVEFGFVQRLELGAFRSRSGHVQPKTCACARKKDAHSVRSGRAHGNRRKKRRAQREIRARSSDRFGRACAKKEKDASSAEFGHA